MANKGTRAVAALIVLCAAANLLYLLSSSPDTSLRRFLVEEPAPPDRRPDGVVGVFPWARKHLRPLDAQPEPGREVVVYWHIPNSGGTTLKSIYECMGRTIASKAGVDPRFGHSGKDEVVAFRPWPGVSRASYVNVDTTSKTGIDRAKRLGLVPSGLVDMIVVSNPTYAVENLFDEAHKGRVLAMFRHPVDRLVSKFYYLRKATWDRQYHSNWQNIDLLEFAQNKNRDNNHMVKRLAGVNITQEATEEDLRTAMRTVKKRFVVGLLDRMEESVHRFNVVMGVDDSDDHNGRCMDHFFHHSVDAKRRGSDPRPRVTLGGAAWNALAEKNALDLRLYESIVQIFDEQRDVIDSYASHVAV